MSLSIMTLGITTPSKNVIKHNDSQNIYTRHNDPQHNASQHHNSQHNATQHYDMQNHTQYRCSIAMLIRTL
jgi:hypothetical protein